MMLAALLLWQTTTIQTFGPTTYIDGPGPTTIVCTTFEDITYCD